MRQMARYPENRVAAAGVILEEVMAVLGQAFHSSGKSEVALDESLGLLAHQSNKTTRTTVIILLTDSGVEGSVFQCTLTTIHMSQSGSDRLMNKLMLSIPNHTFKPFKPTITCPVLVRHLQKELCNKIGRPVLDRRPLLHGRYENDCFVPCSSDREKNSCLSC
ncbi:hypothetical protein V3C99_018185 [Haemonchus contortus]